MPISCYNIVIMAEKNKVPAGSFFWQILFPILIGTVLLLTAAVWVTLDPGPGSISRFAEISTVLLVIPVLVGSLFLVLLFGALIALVLKIIQGVPRIAGKIREFLLMVQKAVEGFSKFVVTPVVRPAALMAGIRRLFTRRDPRVKID